MVFNNKKSRVTSRANLNTFTEWETKTNHVCSVCSVNVSLVSEEYMLFFSLVPKRVVVRVKERDRFLACLAFGKRRFSQGAFETIHFLLGLTFLFSAKDG